MQTLLAGGGSHSALKAICLAQAGRLGEARSLLSELIGGRDFSQAYDGLGLLPLFRLLEAAVLVRDGAVCRAIVGRLSPWSHFLHYWRGEMRDVTAAFDSDRTPRLAEIETPTLLVHGTDDGTVPFSWGQELHRNIPYSEFHAIEGANHAVTRWPEAGEIIRDWIERQLAIGKSPSSI